MFKQLKIDDVSSLSLTVQIWNQNILKKNSVGDGAAVVRSCGYTRLTNHELVSANLLDLFDVYFDFFSPVY